MVCDPKIFKLLKFTPRGFLPPPSLDSFSLFLFDESSTVTDLSGFEGRLDIPSSTYGASLLVVDSSFLASG